MQLTYDEIIDVLNLKYIPTKRMGYSLKPNINNGVALNNTSKKHNNLDIYYLSQSYFDLPKGTIRNNSNKIILFNQTLKDIEHIYRDVAGYDMNCDEFKYLCRKSWEEDYKYVYIDTS